MLEGVLGAMSGDRRSAKQLMAFLEGRLRRNVTCDANYEALAAEKQQALTTLSTQEAAAVATFQQQGRALVEKLAVMLQAAVLIQHAPTEIADSFIAARLSDQRGGEYGALPDGVAIDALVERA